MIEEIEIVEYKGFKNLKLENLSQINIISGKNNVGKTALLEALFIYENIEKDFCLTGILSAKDTFSFIGENRNINKRKLKNYLQKINYKTKNLEIKPKTIHKLNDKEKEEIKKFNQDYTQFLVTYYDEEHLNIDTIDNTFSDNTFYTNYINSSKPSNERLVKLYSNIQSKGIQHKFLTYLKLLDNDIEWIEPQLLDDEMLLRINLKNPERSLVSSELGEGTNRYIEILTSLLSNPKGIVFIDEVENGIHYTKLYDIWRAIIEIVQKEDIQLFVTTHDLESIEALALASEDMKFKEITSIKLTKDKENKIYPIIRNYSSFLATVNSGMDIR